MINSRVTGTLGGIALLAVWLAWPSAAEASLISFDSEIGRSAVSGSSSSQVASETTRARSIADERFRPVAPESIDAFLVPGSNASGAGNASSPSGGTSAPCALSDGASISAGGSLAFRLCESALVVPSPHLDGMLRPPRD